MQYCTKCGVLLEDGSNFCYKCGAPTANSAQQQTPEIKTQAPPVNPPFSAPNSTVKDFSAVTIRYCCPNGHTFDSKDEVAVCPTCGAPITEGGYIQLYRMGNYMGCAVGMGIYVDNIAYGHIANKQSLRIKVPYGTHKLHVTHTTTRKCNDPMITVTPENPCVFCKAYFSKAGFAITIKPATPDEMPTA